MDTLVDLLLRFFASEACSIGFPELLVPAGVLIRGYLKDCKNPKVAKNLKQALDRLEHNSNYVLSKRTQLSATPRDSAKVVSRKVDLETRHVKKMKRGSDKLVAYLSSLALAGL